MHKYRVIETNNQDDKRNIQRKHNMVVHRELQLQSSDHQANIDDERIHNQAQDHPLVSKPKDSSEINE